MRIRLEKLFFTCCFLLLFSHSIIAVSQTNIYSILKVPQDSILQEDLPLLDSCVNIIDTSQIDTVKAQTIFYLSQHLSGEYYTYVDDYLIRYIVSIVQNKSAEEQKVLYYLLAEAYISKGIYYLEKKQKWTADEYFDKAEKTAQRIKSSNLQLSILESIGVAYDNHGFPDDALKYYKLLFETSKELKDSAYIALGLNNMAYIFNAQGKYEEAIKLFRQSLNIYQAIDNKEGIAGIYVNIASIYYMQKDLKAAIEFFKKAARLYKKMNNLHHEAIVITNIGASFSALNEIDSAIYYYEKGLEIKKQLHNKASLAASYNNLGKIYLHHKNEKKGVEYLKKAFQLASEVQYTNAITSSSIGLAEYYLNHRQYDEAEIYASLALQNAYKLKNPQLLHNASKILSDIFIQKNNYKKALEYYQTYVALRDSLFNDKNRKLAMEQKLAFEYEKQKAIEEARHKEALKRQKELADAEKKRHNIIVGFTASVSFIIFIFSVFIYNRMRIIRRQKNIIENQHKMLENKNKEIIDSIEYAKNIQKAILKEEEHKNPLLPEHFILFKPKDIVSGDFYWGLEKDEYFYIAVADCTGHGVPGAFMSMLGIALLNEINATSEALYPDEILNILRDKIIKELNQSAESKTKDGMDISLFRLNLKNHIVDWAGAFNPLLIINPNRKSWYSPSKPFPDNLPGIEVQADRQPVGYYTKMQPFTRHTIQLEDGDEIFIFSDGFIDQFGGPKGKKFRLKNFKKTLTKLYHLSCDEQKKELNRIFEEWKINTFQIDDVTVLGMKIKNTSTFLSRNK